MGEEAIKPGAPLQREKNRHIPYRKVNTRCSSRCENRSQSAVTCDKCLLRADDTLKLWWSSFSSRWLLHLLDSFSWTARWLLLFPSLPKSDFALFILFYFIFFTFFLLFLFFPPVLKQTHQDTQYLFECVLTPHLHTAWFPRGKLVFGMFTFCSHFCSS